MTRLEVLILEAKYRSQLLCIIPSSDKVGDFHTLSHSRDRVLEKQRLVASLVGEVARMRRAFERVLKKAEEAKIRKGGGGEGFKNCARI